MRGFKNVPQHFPRQKRKQPHAVLVIAIANDHDFIASQGAYLNQIRVIRVIWVARVIRNIRVIWVISVIRVIWDIWSIGVIWVTRLIEVNRIIRAAVRFI